MRTSPQFLRTKLATDKKYLEHTSREGLITWDTRDLQLTHGFGLPPYMRRYMPLLFREFLIVFKFSLVKMVMMFSYYVIVSLLVASTFALTGELAAEFGYPSGVDVW